MFHGRISAWKKIIAEFCWHYISVCSLVGHGWKLADDNIIDYQWTSGCIFLQQLINIMCASDTGLEPESQNDLISNRNGLVRDLITLTFGAEYVLKQNIVRKMVFCLFHL